MSVEFRGLLITMMLLLASVALCEEGPGADGKKVRVAGTDDVNEEIEEQKHQERIAAKKRLEAEKLEAERLKELEIKRKFEQIRSEAIAANARYDDLLARKKRFDASVTMAQNEVESIEKKVSALNGQLLDLGKSSGGSRVNYDYSADRKILSERISAEQQKRLLAIARVDNAKALAKIINAEYDDAARAKRVKDAELKAQKPIILAQAKPAVSRPRMIVTLIDGREFTTLMLIQDANEVHFFTVDGVQFKFVRRDVTNIRNEGEDKPE